MVFKKGHKINKKISEDVKENEYGLIEPISEQVSDEEFILKVMKFLGYDKKRGPNYNYFLKSSRPMKSNFKESEIIEVFKR